MEPHWPSIEEFNKIVEENIWMEKMGRFRNVIQGSDGAIYISLESPGRILKVTAK